MKRIILNLTIAPRYLYSFRLRSALAILGVFLGTFSLIVVYNLSDSLALKARLEVEKLGRDLLVVRSGQMARFGRGARFISEEPNISQADIQSIVSRVAYVTEAAPSATTNFPVRFGGVVLTDVMVTGVTPAYALVRNFSVRHGTFISETDNRNRAAVAVLGSRVARRLFGDVDPLGKHVMLQRFPCQVIGVMEEKGTDLSGIDQDTQIFVPLDTYLRRLVNQRYVSTVHVQVTDTAALAPAKTEIESILRRRHKIERGKRDDFAVLDMRDLTELQSEAMTTITILGRVSAIISFLIGGLGILSIMTLMVNERKMEIGIRRAVGSRRRDIMLQFLLESSFISVSGGLVGVVLGFAGSVIVFQVSALPFSVSGVGLIISFAASLLVGMGGGAYPARKAIAVPPVHTLRA